MSPVVKKKRKKITITSQQLLLVLTAVCAFLQIFTFNTNVFEGVLKQAAGYVVVPFQNGIATIGGYLSDRSDELAQLKDVLALNKDLQEQIDQLTIENNQLQQDRYELNNLRSLYDLDQAYSDYDKIGARVISSETDNWFSSFTINKGEEEGVQVDYNVMAGSGLVGRVVSVGPHYAKVISIISDTSSVSATVLATSNNLIVSGSLQSIQSDGTILFSQLSDPDNNVSVGDKVVTSNISDKYLPGILVGYIDSISTSSNNLTKSGTVTPAVDFSHLDEVLVVMEQKQQTGIAFGLIKPNLLVILVASIGFMEGSKAGMWTGFVCGLLADLFAANGVSLISQNGATGDLLGFYALLFLYVGYLCGQANRLFYPEDIKLPLLMITAADLCVNFVCYLIMFLMRARLDIGYYLLHIILPEAVYTIVVAFIFYPLLLLLHKWLWRADRGSTE